MIDSCSFCYGAHRCELPVGHTAPHMIVLRFDVARNPGETAAIGNVPSVINDCSKPLNDKPCVNCKWCSPGGANELFYCEAWMRTVYGGIVPACRVWERK